MTENRERVCVCGGGGGYWGERGEKVHLVLSMIITLHSNLLGGILFIDI